MLATIRLDVEAESLLAELNLFLAELAERPCEISQLGIDRCLAFLEDGGIDFKQTTTSGTGDILLSAELTESFREFMSAVRAGDFDVA